jgi:hypothetical protein
VTASPQESTASRGVPASGTGPARVALIVGDYEQPAWVARLARGLLDEPGLEVFVVLAGEAGGGPDVATQDARFRFSRLALRAFVRYDDRRIPAHADPRRREDLRRIVTADRFVDRNSGEERFTVGIHLVGGTPDPEFLRLFEHGVFSVHHGSTAEGAVGAAPGVREVLAGDTALHAALLLWTAETDTPSVALTSCLRIDRLSIAATAARYYWNLARLLASRAVAVGRGCAVPEASGAPWPPEGAEPTRAAADNLRVLASVGRMGAIRIQRALKARVEREAWTLAVATVDSGLTPLDFDPRLSDRLPELLTPPPGTIWADPFPVRRDGHLYVLFEEMERSRSVGHISLMELTERGEPRAVGPVLAAPYHLSYPFTFEWKGSLFVVPETEQNRTVEVHRCVSWPDRWTLEAVLLDGVSAADATIMEVDGRWWMFTTMNPGRDVDWDTNLYLFHAPEPLGPWVPHPCNPVKSDVRNTRSAGRPFRKGNRLIRPAQDCAERYGHSLVFNEIVRLDLGGFEEREVGRVLPWNRRMVGMHTVNQEAGFLFLDCRLRRRKGG